MKVALFELEEWEKKYFQEHLNGFECLYFDTPFQETDVFKIQDIEAAVIFIYSRMNEETLQNFAHLQYITTMSMGFDHIDLAYCRKHNIAVSNVPTYGEHTVAEHTFALLLAVSRNLIESYKKIREWNFSPIGLTGFDLHGKTLGVLGVGNIGKNVIKIGHGFGMNVVGYKHTPDEALEKELNYKSVTLDELCEQSDIITIHVPYTPQTHHLLNQEAFSKMKNGVIIINTARGGIIDTNALFASIENGKVKGAGLDVLEEEPLLREEKELLSGKYNKQDLLSVLENHMLISHPGVVITPHNAFNSQEALAKIVETTEKNLRAFASRSPINNVLLS